MKNNETIAKNANEENERLLKKSIGRRVLELYSPKEQTEFPPEGYETIQKIADDLGTSKRPIEKYLNDNDIELDYYKNNQGKLVKYISPELKQTIEQTLLIEHIPEGYVSISDFANSLGTSRSTIAKYFEEKNISLSVFKSDNGKVAKCLSPALQEEFIKDNGMEQPPDGYISVSDAANLLKIGANTLRTFFDNQKEVIKKYKSPEDLKPIQYLSPEQIEEYQKTTTFEKPPEGYLTISEFAAEQKVSKDVIRKFFDNGVAKKFRGENGLLAQYLSPEEQKKFIEHYEELISKNQSLEKAPEGYLTIPEFAKRLGIDRDTIDRFINDQRIELAEYKGFNNIAKYLSPEQQDLFAEKRKGLLSLDEAPDGYLTINDFAEITGTSRMKIQSFLNDHSLTLEYFKGKNQKPSLFLSPAIQQKFLEEKKELLSLEKPPEDYLTINEFASLHNVNRKTVENYLTDNPSLYINNNGSPAMYLSPEQQSIVLESMENMKSGTSIPENTVAFYLEKAGQEIKQGLKPDWLKNPKTGRNLEVDILIDQLGIGIEYDGRFYHQDVERDIKKDDLAKKSGHSILHIREDGCPEMPEGSFCIKRKNNDDDADLGECIKKCFELLNIPTPDINVTRDKKDIMAFMRQRVLNKLDSARTFEELLIIS